MDIPIYKMTLDDSDVDLGIKIMSMVGSPAIMTNWVKFNDKPVKLSVVDPVKRIVFGPALIPELPIKRMVMGQEFYLTIDRDTIMQASIKMAKQGVFNKIDTNHDGALVSGATLFESFISDENRVSIVMGYEDLPMGTLYLTGKINNDAQWAKVESGELKGWSIDALFKFQPAETLTNKEVQKVIRQILSKQ